MVMQQRLVMRPEQRLVMTAMLQQAINMLPLTRFELQQAVQQELLANPMLEEGLVEEREVAEGEMPEAPESLPETETDERGEIEIDWENLVSDSYGAEAYAQAGDGQDFPSYEQTLARPESLRDHLDWQLSLSSASGPVLAAARLVVGNIDDSGYFRAELEEVARSAECTLGEAEEALRLVQGFDPAGVGARNLQECLTLQLRSLEQTGSADPDALSLAESLVREDIERLEERHYPRLAKRFKVSLEEIVEAARLIRTLDPQPGLKFLQERVEVAIPDVTVVKRAEGYEVVLNDDGLPPLRLNSKYAALAANRGATPPDVRHYIEERARAAVWFIKSIEQRRQTIMKVSKSIVSFQKEFLDHGVSHLRPLVLRDVAEDIEMHESTVSRVTTGKYMETPQGVFNFKFFFHSGLGSLHGGNTSSVAVKEQIRALVEGENRRKPYTDQQIVEKLREGDVVIARRTVTKYRKELRIPSASRRRQFH